MTVLDPSLVSKRGPNKIKKGTAVYPGALNLGFLCPMRIPVHFL